MKTFISMLLDIIGVGKFPIFLLFAILVSPAYIVFQFTSLKTFEGLQLHIGFQFSANCLQCQGIHLIFSLSAMDPELAKFNKKMAKVESETYFTHFVKPGLKKFLNNHYTQYIVFVGQMFNQTQRAIVDEAVIETAIIQLGLEQYMLGIAELDKGYILGYQFTTVAARNAFTEWVTQDTIHKLVFINPAEATSIKFFIKPFPFGFSEAHLQSQLLNYGQIVDFKYASRKFGMRDILKNEISFVLNLKDGINRNAVPCYIKHNDAFFALSSCQLPPICSLCRKRGHGRLACDFIWCNYCNKKQTHIHDCVHDESQMEQPVLDSHALQSVDLSHLSVFSDSSVDPPASEVPVEDSVLESEAPQPVISKASKQRPKKNKSVLFYDSDTDTCELSDQELPIPMEANVDSQKRKLAEVGTTTSEEDTGVKSSNLTRNAKRSNKK